MKKFFSTLSIFLTVIAFVTFIFSSNVSAHTVPLSKLNNITGDWYDAKGNYVLRIGNDYTFNEFKIVEVDYEADTAESYKLTLVKDGEYYEASIIHFTHLDDYGKSTYFREYLEVGDIVLRRTAEPVYRESVGGIYLGMSRDEVVSRYGQPSSSDGNSRYKTWKYNKQGMDIGFLCDVVDSIKIYSYGDRRFDWSGLSAYDSVNTFISKYNPVRTMNGTHATYLFIGRNELIIKEDNSVTLVMPGPGYVFR